MASERKPPAPPIISDEETQHWQAQLQHVAPLIAAPKIPAPLPPAAPASPPRRRSAAPPLTNAPPPASIERGLLERIGKGREAIEARLDLHGLTEAEARAQFGDFIFRAHARGLRTVLVITGKGRGGEGKLRRALQHWLELEELRGYISGYHTARPTHGGDGAWYLRIRQKG